MKNLKWSPDLPTEEGLYWFYGEPWMGSMGMHYKDDYIPEPEMYLVDVHPNVMTTCGAFISHKPFNKAVRREGWMGYWAKAEMPAAPYDGNYYFKEE